MTDGCVVGRTRALARCFLLKINRLAENTAEHRWGTPSGRRARRYQRALVASQAALVSSLVGLACVDVFAEATPNAHPESEPRDVD